MVTRQPFHTVMLSDFYKQFKSGTDIRGVATDGVEGEPLNMTDEVVCNMAGGFATWLMIFSHWWMKNHKRGPLEGIWNKATWIGTDKK